MLVSTLLTRYKPTRGPCTVVVCCADVSDYAMSICRDLSTTMHVSNVCQSFLAYLTSRCIKSNIMHREISSAVE